MCFIPIVIAKVTLVLFASSLLCLAWRPSLIRTEFFGSGDWKASPRGAQPIMTFGVFFV